jgi:hypothetical protein
MMQVLAEGDIIVVRSAFRLRFEETPVRMSVKKSAASRGLLVAVGSKVGNVTRIVIEPTGLCRGTIPVGLSGERHGVR